MACLIAVSDAVDPKPRFSLMQAHIRFAPIVIGCVLKLGFFCYCIVS
jgi:hypothetical protein